MRLLSYRYLAHRFFSNSSILLLTSRENHETRDLNVKKREYRKQQEGEKNCCVDRSRLDNQTYAGIV